MEMIYNANTNQKKGGVATLISDKVDFWTRNILGIKNSCFIMIKETVHKEDIKILNMHTSNRIPIYMKQKLMEIKR